MPSRQIPPFTYNRFEALSIHTRELIIQADRALAELRVHSDTVLSPMLYRIASSTGFVPLEAPFIHLTHPLSRFVARSVKSYDELADRSVQERRAMGELSRECNAFLSGSYRRFRALIEEVGRSVTGAPNPIRQSVAVGTAYDAAGNRWLYLPPELVDRELHNLWSFTRTDDSGSNVFRAAVFMAAFLTIHPFTDGNGRASRLLGNLLIFGDASIAYEKYLPLKELMIIGQCGFDIACSQARFFGRISIVCRWVANAILTMRDLQCNTRSAPKELLGLETITSRGHAVAAT